ncbi:unnamed protein product [Knipowitschia caucasica]|uniref:Uncharacterized protein n=1 Tax=Knipowitschia caucasica TaxID=637954 RepID=A0AAV2MCI9_KNICA
MKNQCLAALMQVCECDGLQHNDQRFRRPAPSEVRLILDMINCISALCDGAGELARIHESFAIQEIQAGDVRASDEMESCCIFPHLNLLELGNEAKM